MSFLDAWLHGEGSFIGVIMMGVKSIFFRLLIFHLLTFPCGYSWERDYNNLSLTSFLYANTQWNPQLLLPSSCPRSSSCTQKHWKSRPPKRCCPWVHLLGWRLAIMFSGSVRKRHDYSLVLVTIVFFPASRCWSALLPFCTPSSGTATSTGTMSTSASGSAAGYISLLIISIIYMLITFRSHMHIYDVTNMLIIFFWIKLPLKLPNFLTTCVSRGYYHISSLCLVYQIYHIYIGKESTRFSLFGCALMAGLEPASASDDSKSTERARVSR